MTVIDPLASIQRFYDAENEFCSAAPGRRDIGVMLKELDPDIVVDVPRSLPHGGRWCGHAGFEELFAVVTEHWSAFEVVYNDANFHQIDDQRILVEGVFRGVLRDNAAAVEMPFVSLFTFTVRGASRLDHFWKDTGAVVIAASA